MFPGIADFLQDLKTGSSPNILFWVSIALNEIGFDSKRDWRMPANPEGSPDPLDSLLIRLFGRVPVRGALMAGDQLDLARWGCIG